jgi:peptidyl-prolyl cis-trans isomerase B (cyclophilin B)
LSSLATSPRLVWNLLAAAILGLLALALIACGSDDSPPLAPTETATAAVTAAPLPTAIPPVCEGTGISDIERTGERRFTAAPEMVIDTSKTYVAEMQTAKGLIVIELTAEQTPITVNSFVFLSCTGYYDGLTFHRITRDPSLSIIQGGDPRGDGRGGPGYVFEDEVSDDLTHEAGVISMANAGPGTNGSQFFITIEPAPHLNGRHSVFGRLTEGLEVAREIRQGDLILAVSIKEAP